MQDPIKTLAASIGLTLSTFASPQGLEAIEQLAHQLAIPREGVRYSFLQEKCDYLADGPPPRVLLTERAKAMGDSFVAGQPPTMQQVRSYFRRVSGIDLRAEVGEEWDRLTVSAWESSESTLNILEMEQPGQSPTISALLATPGLALVFNSGLDRVTVNYRSPRHTDNLLTWRRLVYPLSVGPEFAGWLAGLDWTHSAGPAVDLYVASDPDHQGDSIHLAFRHGEGWPVAAMYRVWVDEGGESEPAQAGHYEVILSVYRTSPSYPRPALDFPFSEVVTIDSASTKDGMFVQRTFISGFGAFQSPEPLRLPVPFSAQTGLHDLRGDRQKMHWGSDVTAWPQEVLEHLQGS